MDTVYILYCKYYKYTYCIHTYYMNIIRIVNCHFCYTIMFCKYILYTYICIYTVYILYEYHPHCQLSFLLHFPVVVIDRCCSNSTCPLLNQFTEHIFVFKTSQELRMLSTVTLDCQVTKIVMNLGSQL